MTQKQWKTKINWTRRRKISATVAALLGVALNAVPVTVYAQNGAGAGGAASGTTGAGNSTGTAAGTNGTAAGTTGATSGIGAAPGTSTTGTGAAANSSGTGTSATGTSGNGTGNQGTSAPMSGTVGVSGQSNTSSGNTAASGQGAASLPLAGTNERSVYNLAQTIAAALASSSDLQIAARNVEIDRRRSDQAAAAGRPNVNASAQATRFDQATEISIGGSPPVQVVPKHTEELTINLAERLDITGQIRAASDQARLQSLADQFDYDYIRDQRILRAKSIYFNLLRAEHQVQVAQSSLATAQRQLQDAQNLNAAQVGQKIDVYRAATQVANAQQQLTAATNNRDIARQNFNDLVGRPLPAPVQAEDVAGVNVGVDVSAPTGVGAASPVTVPPFSVPPSEISAINIDQSLNTAFAVRPEILENQVNVRVAETGVKLARAGLEPTLAVNADGNYYPTTSFQNPRKRVALVTATLNIPLYDGGATRDLVAEARLRTQNAQTSLDSTREDVALDVRQSYLNLSTAARQIDAANTALQQAVAARQLAEVRYRGQVGTYLEVTDAQAALVQAENNQVDAVYDYLVARAQFENALGTPQTQ